MKEFRKNLEMICGTAFKDLQIEVDLFIQMMDNLDYERKSLIKDLFNRSLMRNKLTMEKVKDPFFLEDILNFFEEIKQSNFDHFENGEKTGEYDHYSHGYVMYHIINSLKGKPKNIDDFKKQHFDNIYLHGTNLTPEEGLVPYIKINFNEFELPYYTDFFKRISKAARDDLLYSITPVLLRCVFEDLLHLILMKSLHTRHTELYYNTSNNRIRNISQLIALFDLLRKEDYKNLITITDDIIKKLEEIRKLGNYSIHDVVQKVTRDFIVQWEEQLEITLKILLKSYLILKDEKIELSLEREQFIKKQLKISKKPVKPKSKSSKARKKKNPKINF